MDPKLPSTSKDVASDLRDEDIEEIPTSEEEAVAIAHSVDPLTVPIMRCNHVANAAQPYVDHDGNRLLEYECVLCLERTPLTKAILGPNGEERTYTRSDLRGREARCICKATAPSDTPVTFLIYQKNKDHDLFYCGHGGWDEKFVKTLLDRMAGKKVVPLHRSGKLKKWHK